MFKLPIITRNSTHAVSTEQMLDATQALPEALDLKKS